MASSFLEASLNFKKSCSFFIILEELSESRCGENLQQIDFDTFIFMMKRTRKFVRTIWQTQTALMEYIPIKCFNNRIDFNV